MKHLSRYLLSVIFLIVVAVFVILYTRQSVPEQAIVPREEKTIRILEGWTNQDMANYFAKNDLWPADEFLAVAGSVQAGYTGDREPNQAVLAERFSWLPAGESSLEGYLFPDTYRVFATSTPGEVIVKMLDNFDRKITAEMRSDIAAQDKTLEEIIVMASLIEKEAPITNASGGDRDAQLISGIFWNRLALGQALQSDATLSYIFSDNKPAHSGVELEVDSPYNTYKYPGLPPGPIGNPGLLAIRAAIYPAATDYYYFLTPPDSREVIYARSYAEHLQNKDKYLR